MRKKLKLFVWTDFCPDYTSGLAVAIAYTEEEARVLVEKEYGIHPSDWGTLTIHPLNKTFAACVSGGS